MKVLIAITLIGIVLEGMTFVTGNAYYLTAGIGLSGLVVLLLPFFPRTKPV